MTDGKLVFLPDMHRVFNPFWKAVTTILEEEIKPLIQAERKGATLIRFVCGVMHLNLQHYYMQEIARPGRPGADFDEFVVTKKHVASWKNTDIYRRKIFL